MKNYIFQLCTYDKLSSNGNNNRNSWLMSLSEINYYKGGSTVDIPMVCQKIIGTDGNLILFTYIPTCLFHVYSCA